MDRFAQRFMLEREIGAGGMARVFLGRDEVLERDVAIKIIKPGLGGTEVGDRFQREGRTAARLSHPNIVPVYGAGEGEFEGREVSYIVMEYVPGGDLKALIDREGCLSNSDLARLGSEISFGLAHAHEKGVIHRDIKPHNVLIDSRGRSKLADFGIARALDATQATQTGSYLGTALYSSPEQLQGEKVTTKSDVYSLGVTLYQATVGETPFTGTPIEIASQHVNKMPPTPSARGALLSDETETLILDCIQKDPDRRPNAEEVHERLLDATVAARSTRARAPAPSPAEAPTIKHTRAYPETPAAETPPGDARRKDDRGRKRRGLAILAVAALLLILLGVAAYAATFLGGGEPDVAQAPQEENQQQATPSEDAESQDALLSGGGEEQTSAGGGQENTGAGGAAGGSSEEDPARVVQEFYQAAVDKDFGRSSGLMTPEWRQAWFPEQGQFEGTYSTLKNIEFVEGPTVVETSGDTATVTGETMATHTNRTEQNKGTWILVYQNGEWRINWWEVQNISTVYV